MFLFCCVRATKTRKLLNRYLLSNRFEVTCIYESICETMATTMWLPHLNLVTSPRLLNLFIVESWRPPLKRTYDTVTTVTAVQIDRHTVHPETLQRGVVTCFGQQNTASSVLHTWNVQGAISNRLMPPLTVLLLTACGSQKLR